MRIIYAGVKNYYLDLKRGNSFEHNNFWGTLEKMKGVQAIYFSLDRILEVGRKKTTEELEFNTLNEIKKYTKSIAWMSDDHWRFHNYSKYYAPYITYMVTTYSRAVDWYKSYGFNNVIRSQWASNPNYWFSVDMIKDIDVSFVGQKNRSREKVVNFLR